MSAPLASSLASPARTARLSVMLRALIIDSLSNGQTLRQVCRDLQIDYSVVYRYKRTDPEFQEAFALARADGRDVIADEILEIADDASLDPKARKVKIDARLDLLARWESGSYNPTVKIESTNRNMNVNATIGNDPNEAAAAYRDVIEGRPAT